MENKVKSKQWDLNKISSDLTPEELLDAWKKAMLAETSRRKAAFNKLENFKEWWLIYLKALAYSDKVHTFTML